MNFDKAMCGLWTEMARSCGLCPSMLTLEDQRVWNELCRHPMIKERLKNITTMPKIQEVASDA